MSIDFRKLSKIEFSKNKNVHILSKEELRKLQLTELQMVKDFLKVAESNHLHYTLGGGSVLGAIRHKGFIPWDDDIDINMPREDYNKFLELFEINLSNKYELCCPEKTRNHGMAHTQIQKKGTVFQSFNELSKDHSGIYIDVFVMENVPNNRVIRFMHGILCLMVGYILTCRKTFNDMPYLRKYIDDNVKLKKVISKKYIIGKMFSFIPLDVAAKTTVKVYSLCKNNNSEYVTFPSGRRHYFGEIGKREEMGKTLKVPFEDMYINIPKGYENYMKRLYGTSYMEIPPKSEREQHPIMKLEF